MIKFKSFSSNPKKFFIDSSGYAVLNPGPGIRFTSLKKPLREDSDKKLSTLHALPGQYQSNSDHHFTIHT